MAFTPQPAADEAAAIQERLGRVLEGMEVEDATGEVIGKVTFVKLADPTASDPGRGGSGASLAEGYMSAMGERLEANLPPPVAGRLLRSGYLKIDDRRRFRKDHHYYAVAEDIVAVDEARVRLGKSSADLITPGG